MNEQEKEIFRLSYLSEARKTKIFTRILKDIMAAKPNAKTEGRPQMRIIMGFPGSGKSLAGYGFRRKLCPPRQGRHAGLPS